MKKLKKKGQLISSVQALSAVAIAFFVFFIVIFATLKGMNTVKGTISQTTIANNNTRSNMTALEDAAGQFSQYASLIVIVAILAVVIALVSSAFTLPRGR